MPPSHQSPRRQRGPRRSGAALAAATAASAAIVLVAIGLQGAPAPAPDIRNGRSFIQDNLWSTETAQYAVWVERDGTPLIGKRQRRGADWQIVDLASIPDNPLATPTVDDEHNVYVVAVDSQGYVHVMGNAHSSPLAYIRSSAPGDIRRWEQAELAGPAARVTYPMLVGLADGSLLCFRREGEAGDGATLLDVLEPGEQAWRHAGVVLDGRPTGESPYLHHVAVDPRNDVVHLMFEWRADHRRATTNDVEHALSRDGGATWETLDGRRVPLPITHGAADVVLDTASQDAGLGEGGGFVVDSHGRPHGVVVLSPVDAPRSVRHLWHDGRAWHQDAVDVDIDGRPAVVAGDDGGVWLLGARGRDLVLIAIAGERPGESRSLGRVPPGWEATFDSQALARWGAVEVLLPREGTPRVAVAPLAGD